MKNADDLSPLGQHIRRFRKQNRYSMAGFGEISGLSKAQVFGIEHGTEYNPRLNTLIGIAKATGTTLARVATLAAASIPGNINRECQP